MGDILGTPRISNPKGVKRWTGRTPTAIRQALLTVLDTRRDRAGNYVDIPSDTGLTPQHNSLAHNIKLYAERLPMFRAPETAVGLVRQ